MNKRMFVLSIIPYVVHGRLEATIAQANAGDSVTVTVWIEG